jgi:hypothetical protein
MKVSNNYLLYAAKMEELRVCREVNRPSRSQLQELLLFVKYCEAQWAHEMQANDGSQRRD